MFTPYRALWRTDVPASGVEYRLVTVVSPPVFGHVKCRGTPMEAHQTGWEPHMRQQGWALPLADIVAVDGDGYAVLTGGQ